MDESELCVAETAKFGTPAQMLVAGRLLAHPEAYRRWESEHALLMRQVSGHTYLNRQVVALRSTALALMHRKSIFEYLQERRLTRAQRHRLMSLFHSFKDYTSSIIAEHGNYLRGASSYWCSHHVARRLMKDAAFAEPLHLYQERYTDFFRVFCDVALAQTDEEKRLVEPLRMLQPLLKLQLAEARREILTMSYRPTKIWREVQIRRPTGDTAKLRSLNVNGLARQLSSTPSAGLAVQPRKK
ncbi:MAG: hypothetical protein ACREVV_16845 [Steroidobacteraceae bacterium]